MIKLLSGRPGLLCAFVFVFGSVAAQDFSWIKGTTLTGQAGDYGTISVPAVTNKPGGREGAASWKDPAGNFWLFGGDGHDNNGNSGPLCDLWKYTVANNQWTFVNGNNTFAQITVYGPIGIPTFTAKPGSRHGSASWTDASGNLWLMGGYGYDGSGIGYLNDLWKYTIGTDQWTWMNGGNTCFSPGVYGTLGVPASTNTPGSRMNAVTWTDGSGNLWLFGGYGTTTSSTTIGSLDDVWRYNVANNTWTWMKGSMLKDLNGVYGTLGTAAPTNNPGSRSLATGWIDGTGNFWMFGGNGYDQTSSISTGMLNDLWKYNMNTSEWTWIKGTNTIDQPGVYGTQGIGTQANIPGGRSGSMTWKDVADNVWLFGGKGYSGTSGPGVGSLNDLWKYNPSTNEFTWLRGTALINQNGVYGSMGIPAASNLPGGRNRFSAWMDASNDLYIFGGAGFAAGGPTGKVNDLWKYMNCYISPITMTITTNDATICPGQTTSLTVVGSSSYLWLHSLSTQGYVLINPSVNTTYTVLTSDAKGCKYSAFFTQVVGDCTGIDQLSGNNSGYSVYPNPGAHVFNIALTDNSRGTQLTVFNSVGQEVLKKSLFLKETEIKNTLPKGIYYYMLERSDEVLGSGKLVIE